MRSKISTRIVSNTDRTIAISVTCAPQQIPTAIDQNRNTRSMGSFTAVLNLTIERAPTIPREITILDCTASMIPAVITAIAAMEILKFLE